MYNINMQKKDLPASIIGAILIALVGGVYTVTMDFATNTRVNRVEDKVIERLDRIENKIDNFIFKNGGK